jgi:hypothetical protein
MFSCLFQINVKLLQASKNLPRTKMFDELSSTPPDVAETAQEVVSNLLSGKSREIYECAYNLF